MNIFESDIFTLARLTAAINEVEYVPNQIGGLGLFEANGISTTSLVIEKDGEKLGLVENKPRGAPGTVVGGSKRTGISFQTAHLPTTATILADEVQNVRAFGSEDQMQAVQTVVNGRLATMARRIDMTHEHHRLGAIMGQVLDSDGTTVIYDLFHAFGITQQTVAMALGTATTDVQGKCLDIHEKIEDALGGLSYTGVTVVCGKSFWRKFIGHKLVKEAYERWQSGAQLRADPREGFMFGGIFWERYRGGGTIKVADTEAYAVPLGVMDLFITRFAPGDYMETVNTLGLPFYSSSEPMKHGKGVELEAQSNPAHLCTRPKACIKLTE
ncbi:major capsid protein [Billgrantia bachuensis]|uniref:Major capsid protein n=1 Tax=Billgrantia bachuensis TaxID=2717286 RepID=A0ABX0PRU5_9GAMM|nr:major capsid protein [Halomonas bachuensis]NIC05260.1 major capsid protein [Halomonas bachuensis]